MQSRHDGDDDDDDGDDDDDDDDDDDETDSFPIGRLDGRFRLSSRLHLSFLSYLPQPHIDVNLILM